jgi:hypothetical protein
VRSDMVGGASLGVAPPTQRIIFRQPMGLISPTNLMRSAIVKLPKSAEGRLGVHPGCLKRKEFGSPSINPKNTSASIRLPTSPSRSLPLGVPLLSGCSTRAAFSCGSRV